MNKDMKLATIDARDVATLRKRIHALTRDGVNDALGISWDTWKKVTMGLPVSESTQKRLHKKLLNEVSVSSGDNDDDFVSMKTSVNLPC